MHITFAMVGATFGFKPSIKLCFLICYLHIIVFTPLFNVFFLRCLFVILCFILYFAFSRPSFICCLFLRRIWYPSSMVLCRAKTKTCYSVFSSGTRKRFAYSSSRDCVVPVVAMYSSPTSCYIHPAFVAWPQSLNRVDLTMWTTVLTMNVIGLLKVGRRVLLTSRCVSYRPSSQFVSKLT